MGSVSSKSPAKAPPAGSVGACAPGTNPDPRSPTPDVARTPLKDNAALKHSITKNVDLSATLENSKPENMHIHNNPIFSAVIRKHLQSYDPRSPAQDFERTPIVLPSHLPAAQRHLLRLQANHDDTLTFPEERDPQNVLESSDDASEYAGDGLHTLSIDSSFKEPEPLGSSTVSQEVIENNVSATQPPGLLETNFDYIDNDNEDKFDTPEQSILKAALRKRFDVIEADPRSPSLGIERTPIVVAKTDEDSTETFHDSVEEMSEECLIQALRSSSADFRNTLARANDKNKHAVLIYEDDSSRTITGTPIKTKSASNSGARTPLSCMRNKGDENTRSNSANTLGEAKKRTVSKIPKRVSNVPRLQMTSKLVSGASEVLSEAGSVPGDYENTPPHSHRDAWDKDTSVVL